MQSPNIFSNEHADVVKESDDILEGSNLLIDTKHIQNVINDVNMQLLDTDDDAESKLAALEEHTRQLLMELQVKRNEVTAAYTINKVESGWAERERNAIMRAEAAEARAQCAVAATYRLAEERETLNRMAMEIKGKCDALVKENELLLTQMRSLSAEVLSRERREREALAEKASYEAIKRTLHDKMEKMRDTVEEVNKWMATTEETMRRFRGEVDAMKTLESKVKEDTAKKDAVIQDLMERLKGATETIANMAAKIGALEARVDVST